MHVFPTIQNLPLLKKDNLFLGWSWTDYALGIAGGTLAVVAAPVVLGAAGFTGAGVAAGSLAAGVQSAAYGGAVASGSVFAGLQSAGAAGLGAKATIAVFSTAAGGTVYLKDNADHE